MPALPPTLCPTTLRRLLRHAAAGLTAAGAIAGAAVVAAPPAAVLADPTRPPAALAAVPGPVASGRVTPAARPDAAPRAEAGTAPRLQSLRVPAQGPASALIDGRVVKLGDSVGDRVVAAIDANGVLLRSAGARNAGPSGDAGERRLRLLGGDEKQPPGTIQITRSARWQPPADALPADAALAGASAPQRAAPVSLAERTRP